MDFSASSVAPGASPEVAYAQEKEALRRKAFKATIDADDARRKREEVQIKIRKEKRMDRLRKRRQTARHATAAHASSSPGYNAGAGAVMDAQVAEQIPILVQGVNSRETAQQLAATASFRKMLSIESNPPIQQVIDSGIVPRLVTFLRRDDSPRLQFEAAWALTNIASGTSTHTHFVVDSGAVDQFVYLLDSPSDDVREQAVWALGNIAGDSPTLRDHVLKRNALPPLVRQLQLDCKLGMVRNSTWTLSNFCRGKPQPPFELVEPALDTLAHLVFSSDEEVLTDACWALSYLSDGQNIHIQAVIQSGVCTRLMELLNHPSPAVQTPALRTVGNIVTGDDLQTQVVISCGALQALAELLLNSRKGIRKEACWTLSNITAGNKYQIAQVIRSGVLPPLINLLANDTWDIKKEAAWAVSNATSGGSPEHVRELVKAGCIAPLCDLLDEGDPKVVTVALEGLENILSVGEQDKVEYGWAYNPYANEVEEAGGTDLLETMWSHENHDVYYKALRILRTFWRTTEAPVDPGLQQNVAGDGTYNFGTDIDNAQFVEPEDQY